MFYFIENTPFPVLITIVLLLVGLCLFAFFDTEKKKTGHPAKYIFLFSLPLVFSVIINKYFFKKYGIENVYSEVLTFVTVIIVYITFVITFILSHKKGYTNSEMVKQNKVITILTVFAIGVAIIYWGIKCFNRIFSF